MKMALLKMVNDMIEAVDLGHTTILITLYLFASFDNIDHSILLSKLRSSFGVTGPALSLVRSYLTDRKSFIKMVVHHHPSLSAIRVCRKDPFSSYYYSLSILHHLVR